MSNVYVIVNIENGRVIIKNKDNLRYVEYRKLINEVTKHTPRFLSEEQRIRFIMTFDTNLIKGWSYEKKRKEN